MEDVAPVIVLVNDNHLVLEISLSMVDPCSSITRMFSHILLPRELVFLILIIVGCRSCLVVVSAD